MSTKIPALGKQSSIASLNFGKRGGHLTPSKKVPFKIPDGYDSNKLNEGFEKTSSLKKPKSFISMGKMPARDNKMYNFDPTYVKDLKREHRKQSFTLCDYLPNSLKKDSTPSQTFFRKYSSIENSSMDLRHVHSTISNMGYLGGASSQILPHDVNR